MLDISSSENKNFKRWVSLASSSGIKKNQQFLVSGPKIVSEIDRNLIGEVLISNPNQLEDFKDLKKKTVYKLTTELFKELDQFNTKAPLLVGHSPELGTFEPTDKPQGVEVITAIGDPANLGALLRVCEGFKVGKVILLEEACHPHLPKCSKAASGSNFKVPLERGPSIKKLSDQNILALDLNGESLYDFKWPKNIRILLGEEGQGLPSSFGGKKIQIPMAASLESLNVVSAGSIALFSYRTQYH